ncbi:hypothetical protein ACHAWF_004176 [Thalassiosira exigua]
MLSYCQLTKHPKHSKDWPVSSANKFCRFMYTGTISFIHRHGFAPRSPYPITHGLLWAATAPTVLTKLQRPPPRCVILMKDVKVMMLEIKDFYLNTPIKQYEYIKLALTYIHAPNIEAEGLVEKLSPTVCLR